SKYDLTIVENRTNIFSLLRDCEQICLSESEQQFAAFDLLYQVWEKVSGKLWNLGYWYDYFQCGNVTLNCAKMTKNIVIQAQLLGEMGWLRMEWEDFVHANSYFQECLQIYQVLDDARNQCRMFRYLGVLAHRQGELNLALNYYSKAWQIVKDNQDKLLIDDKWAFQEAELPNIIGCVYLELAEFAASYNQLKLSLQNYQKLLENFPQLKGKYRYYLADPLLNMGRWYCSQANYKKAEDYYQECRQLSQEINRPDTMAEVLLRMAELAEVEGNLDEALRLAEEAVKVAGTEVKLVRDRAASFTERLLNNQAS
ncbi:MAG: tetratricopeptide repeat protein, partial [Oscillatoria sp. PMC 1076.18]|nr:tetratricopeptide repeat protein [Oscillatoria sp. PMC 1076.18]